MTKKFSPDWDFSFMMDATVTCAFCLKSDMPMLVRGGQLVGICEPCAVIAHYLWRQEPGEVPPEYPESAQTEVARVYILLPKLGKTNVAIVDGKEVHTKPDPMLPSSYEFVMRTNDEGILDLPGVNVLPGETLRMAAERALTLVRAMTWPIPSFIEPLYTAYTPRGRLAAVMLVTAWRLEKADAVEDGLDWRKWPLSTKETSMAGFYKALETVWAMRLFQHYKASSHTEMISVRVRGAGANYIRLQQRLREKAEGLDTSLAELMRRLMTDDEMMIDKLVGEHEVLSRELSTQKKEDAQVAVDMGDTSAAMIRMSRGEQVLVGGGSGGEPSTSRQEKVEAVEGDATTEEEGEAALEDDSVDAETSDDSSTEDEPRGEVDEGDIMVPAGPPPEGFVRRGRDLSMKKEPG